VLCILECLMQSWGTNRLANTKVQPIRSTFRVQVMGIELHQPFEERRLKGMTKLCMKGVTRFRLTEILNFI